jgi:hypothetical protein
MDDIIASMRSFLEAINNNVKNWEYGSTPETLVVLLPGVAQITQYLQLDQIKDTQKKIGLALQNRIHSINTAHAIGGIIRAITWLFLSIFFHNPYFMCLTVPALYQAFSSAFSVQSQIASKKPLS